MNIHHLNQGSPEWLAYRATMRNASDAPAMMGCSPYKTRAQLLRELHTGVPPEVDAGTQKRFDNGHRAEALARPLAEEFIGVELYPVTGSLGNLSASFDGLTLDETEGFEHKALNDAIRAAFALMCHSEADGLQPCQYLPAHHRMQMEQQLHVSGARRILFMASAWTADEELIEELHCWYYPDASLRQQILDGWAQFDRDLAAYAIPNAAEPAPVGRTPDALPALRIEVTGAVTASNLGEFRATALAAIRAVNRDLRTDADFADASKAAQWCADVEIRLAAAKDHALSQTASIDALFRALDEISAEARAVRLDLDKLVKRRKDEVREQAVMAARKALDAHIATLQAELAPMRPQPVPADFAGAIKGLRSIASMQDALDSTLAQAKIAADTQARVLRRNLAHFKAHAAGYEFLFADLGQLVHKATDDFALAVSARIDQHIRAEAERASKAEAEAQAKAQAQAQAALAAAAAPAVAPPQAQQAPTVAAQDAARQQWVRAAAPQAAEPATLKLGIICERLGFIVRADFLADTLHIRPASKADGRPGLYTESQFALICRQLQSHVSAMGELYAGEGVK